MAQKHYFYANGKRKTSVARVRMYKEGEGNITINGRPLKEYFHGVDIGIVTSPLSKTDNKKAFDINILVKNCRRTW